MTIKDPPPTPAPRIIGIAFVLELTVFASSFVNFNDNWASTRAVAEEILC